MVPNARLTRLVLICLVFLAAGRPPLGIAQNTVQWTTNYYTVTGSTLGDLHQSLRQKRPWKDRRTVDGFTEWRADWRFTFAPGPNGCRLTGFTTKTFILTTLPRWTPPTNAPTDLSNTWSNYIRALALHEAGHASIGLAAATELQQRAKTSAPTPDCPSLEKNVNDLGQRTLVEYRLRDEQYDAHTRNGATQGVILPRRTNR